MFLILCNFFSLLLLKSAVQIKLRFFRSPNVIYTFSASLSGSDFQPCGLLTIFTAIQSFSYGSRLAAFGMEINPFNPNALDVSTCGHDYWQKWGEAERSETLLLTLERGLFKFSAPAPPLEVLLKLEPRIGTASPLLTAYSHNIKSRCYPAIYHCFYLQHRRFQPCCRSVIYNTRQSCTLFHLSFVTIFHTCAWAGMVSCLGATAGLPPVLQGAAKRPAGRQVLPASFSYSVCFQGVSPIQTPAILLPGYGQQVFCQLSETVLTPGTHTAAFHKPCFSF